ncbi:MAG: hypothetical protein J0H06_01595, partial [Actinobacteria bacterium]|nr:hypothetical protein [Actinomycetota bacterium]
GARFGVDDLGGFFAPGQAPAGTSVATFDALYAQVTARVGQSQAIDRAVEERLSGAWPEWVDGCRSLYS